MIGLKTVTNAKVSPQMVNPRDIVGNAEEVNVDAVLCRNLRIIAMQIEVTQFLEQCLQGGAGEAAAVATQFVARAKSSTVLPTLFGNPDHRKEVVKMVRQNVCVCGRGDGCVCVCVCVGMCVLV